MNRYALAAFVTLVTTPVLAQQPPTDPMALASNYRQMYLETSDRLAATTAQASSQLKALTDQIADLQKQLDAEKAKSAPATEAKP